MDRALRGAAGRAHDPGATMGHPRAIPEAVSQDLETRGDTRAVHYEEATRGR